ncbi:MAG: hypothetical protein H7A33_04470 [Deltaproteobacteria bacterium]|nr:hypothetical protein [Deltaproteobacteria bacterium]
MSANIAILPIFLPFCIALLFLVWRSTNALRRTVAGSLALLLFALSLKITHQVYVSDIIVLKVGGWQPPFGIALTIDLFSAIMLCLSTLTAFFCLLHSFTSTKQKNENVLYLPLFFFLLTGINMAFATGDLFNLFVSFEVMLISSYALMTLEAKGKDVKFAFSYITINLIGSTLFLLGAALLYAHTGTLNYADIAQKSQDLAQTPYFQITATILFFVFAIKAGMFPLYYWLPKSYPVLSFSSAGFFGGMLTKVGVYAILRLFCTILPHNMNFLHNFLLYFAVPTMIFGVLGAVAQSSIKRILSYHIISQVGFMLLAIGFFTPLGITAAILYIIHHILVKASLFLIGGLAEKVCGTDELEDMGGLWRFTPIIGILFLFQALSLAGIPPLSGFWGKYLILVVAVAEKHYAFAFFSLLASVLTLMSMLKIWLGAFWKPAVKKPQDLKLDSWQVGAAVLALMVCCSLVIGLGVGHFYELAQQASDQLLDQSHYIEAVLALEGATP